MTYHIQQLLYKLSPATLPDVGCLRNRGLVDDLRSHKLGCAVFAVLRIIGSVFHCIPKITYANLIIHWVCHENVVGLGEKKRHGFELTTKKISDVKTIPLSQTKVAIA